MANTYFGLGTITVSGSTTSQITFSGIPSTYTDLVILCTARSSLASTNDNMVLRVNGNSGNNYSSSRVNSTTGTSISATRSATTNQITLSALNAANQTTSIFSNYEIYFPKYADTARAKTISWWGNGPSNTTTGTYSGFGGGQYGQINSDFTAISSIQLSISGSNFVAGSSFSLYGIS